LKGVEIYEKVLLFNIMHSSFSDYLASLLIRARYSHLKNLETKNKEQPSYRFAPASHPYYPLSETRGDIRVSIITIQRYASLPNCKLQGYDNKGSAIKILVESLNGFLSPYNEKLEETMNTKLVWVDDRVASSENSYLLGHGIYLRTPPNPDESLFHCRAYEEGFQWDKSFSKDATKVTVHYYLTLQNGEHHHFVFKDVLLPVN
jgi:hypothetical protein